MKNQVKDALKQGRAVLGIFMVTSGPDTAQILAGSGVDFIIIDCEHGSADLESAGRMVPLVKFTGASPIIRTPWNDFTLIKRTLDSGAEGIMIPMINTAEQAAEAVDSCKYPPVGRRGFGGVRATLFGSGGGDPEYAVKANDEILVIAQIEHVEAVKNIDAIASVKGVDVAFVGPFDLSYSMGIPRQIDHPDMWAAYEKVADSCKRNSVIPGILTTPSMIKKHIEMGYKFLLCGTDSMLLFAGAKGLVNTFKELTQ